MKIPDLALPHSGGKVSFRDDDDLNGLDYRKLRYIIVAPDKTSNDTLAHGAALMITSWDIPSRPDLPKPSFKDDGTVDVGSYGLLNWRDVAAIEQSLTPFLNEVATGVPREGSPDPKDPTNA